MSRTPKRRVRYLNASSGSPRDQIKRFFLSFSPANFRDYWLNREGVIRLAKIGGVGFLGIALVFLWFAKDLPSPSKINARLTGQTTTLYDRTGTVKLYEVHGEKNRVLIGFDEIPESVKKATISIEDKSFYDHGAFSIFGLGRALTGVIFNDRSKGGGSTITQQYVKNALLTSERSLSRKIKELILAIEIEQFYSKDDILKLYLNEIPYGNGAYGIEAACRTYFSAKYGKEQCAKNLNVSEAAFLASLPQLPSYYNPYGQHADALVARQNRVLDEMADQGYITQDEASSNKISVGDYKQKLGLNARPEFYSAIKAPHFSLYVQEMLEEKYGVAAVQNKGMKVITTLDWDKQQLAEKAVKDRIDQVRKLGGSNAALVASDPKTGEILSMVGSYDFSDPDFGAFNVATAYRQPGSSFKPIVYASLISQNKDTASAKAGTTFGAGTTFYDVQTDFGGGYKPRNYSGSFYGVQTLRTALAGSLNIPAVKALYMGGVQDSLDMAHAMGITTLKDSPQKYGLSLVLGSGEVKLADMANAYGAFANGGQYHDQHYWLKLEDPNGKIIEELKPNKAPKRVLDKQVAYIISNILSDNSARSYIFGANNPLVLPGRTAAVKTGTTNDYKDAWTMGYTPSLVAGVWAGNNNNASMSSSASTVAAPIWNQFMRDALKGQPNEQFDRPAEIKTIALDKDTGRLPTDGTKNRTSDIFPSWYIAGTPADSRTAKVDKVSGKLATECTPELAIETRSSSEIHAEIPATDPLYRNWEPPVQELAARLGYKSGSGSLPTESDDVHSCSDIKPKVTIDVTSKSEGIYEVKAVVDSGTHTANKVELRFDDQIIGAKTINGDDTYLLEYTPTSNGVHTFRAIVTDDKLYTGEDSKSVNITGVGGGANGDFKGVSPTNNAAFSSTSSINFSWSAAGGATSYRLIIKRSNVVYRTVTVTATSTTQTAFIPGTYTWTVEAIKAGNVLNTTNPLKFSVS